MRQARSELTRRKIIDAAVDLFGEIGYSATGLGDIIVRADVTKGAFYYHFDAKESLATAIIEEGGASILNTFRTINQSAAPALENILHGVFVVLDAIATDKIARVTTQLLRGLAGFNEVAQRIYGSWLDEVAYRVRQAVTEGDVRDDIDPTSVAELILGAMLAVEVLPIPSTVDTVDNRRRLARSWEVLLPAIATADSVSYFREFLARETLRRQAPGAAD